MGTETKRDSQILPDSVGVKILKSSITDLQLIKIIIHL